eukprot:TRINITY_DN956_c0_g1_i1.p1 TRINITY_DN956_c0_g1~~TRINITY_DN956_c0_g1_i1.p1  ORF type:complete len:881 (+),score=257.28 TRINITY_DN956_c0_g1_i1:32-2644(+)
MSTEENLSRISSTGLNSNERTENISVNDDLPPDSIWEPLKTDPLFVLKSLWIPNQEERLKLRILDVVMIEEGVPTKWLMTTKDGYVRKRYTQHLRYVLIKEKFLSSFENRSECFFTIAYVNSLNEYKSFDNSLEASFNLIPDSHSPIYSFPVNVMQFRDDILARNSSLKLLQRWRPNLGGWRSVLTVDFKITPGASKPVTRAAASLVNSLFLMEDDDEVTDAQSLRFQLDSLVDASKNAKVSTEAEVMTQNLASFLEKYYQRTIHHMVVEFVVSTNYQPYFFNCCKLVFLRKNKEDNIGANELPHLSDLCTASDTIVCKGKLCNKELSPDILSVIGPIPPVAQMIKSTDFKKISRRVLMCWRSFLVSGKPASESYLKIHSQALSSNYRSDYVCPRCHHIYSHLEKIDILEFLKDNSINEPETATHEILEELLMLQPKKASNLKIKTLDLKRSDSGALTKPTIKSNSRLLSSTISQSHRAGTSTNEIDSRTTDAYLPLKTTRNHRLKVLNQFIDFENVTSLKTHEAFDCTFKYYYEGVENIKDIEYDNDKLLVVFIDPLIGNFEDYLLNFDKDAADLLILATPGSGGSLLPRNVSFETISLALQNIINKYRCDHHKYVEFIGFGFSTPFIITLQKIFVPSKIYLVNPIIDLNNIKILSFLQGLSILIQSVSSEILPKFDPISCFYPNHLFSVEYMESNNYLEENLMFPASRNRSSYMEIISLLADSRFTLDFESLENRNVVIFDSTEDSVFDQKSILVKKIPNAKFIDVAGGHYIVKENPYEIICKLVDNGLNVLRPSKIEFEDFMIEEQNKEEQLFVEDDENQDDDVFIKEEEIEEEIEKEDLKKEEKEEEQEENIDDNSNKSETSSDIQ